MGYPGSSRFRDGNHLPTQCVMGQLHGSMETPLLSPSVTTTAVSRRVLGGVRASPPPGTTQTGCPGYQSASPVVSSGVQEQGGAGLNPGGWFPRHWEDQRTQPCSGQLLHCVALCDPMDWPARLLCPWYCPYRNTEAGCHFLLQGIFPTQRSNLHLLHCRQILYR